MGVKGDRGPPSSVTLPDPEAVCPGLCHGWQGGASPAAGVVGALGAVADGTEGPLGAADGGCSARIPAGQVGPVGGKGSHDHVAGEAEGLGLGVPVG